MTICPLAAQHHMPVCWARNVTINVLATGGEQAHAAIPAANRPS